MSALHGGPAAALFGALALVVAVPAAAQLTPEIVTAEADRLHAEAEAIGHSSDRIAEVVRKHEQALELRLATDPKLVECTLVHARYLHWNGQVAEAQGYLERAARLALARGDYETAAMTYVDAALTARELGNGAEVARLVGAAQAIAESPGLDAAVRNRIRSRLPSQVARR